MLVDTQGGDALPLLALTPERLYRDYGSDGDLRLEEYEDMGFVEGSITKAIENALDNSDKLILIPSDRAEQMSLLREAFISGLAIIDLESKEPKRAIAEWESLSDQSKPLVELLVSKHLLVKDDASLNVDNDSDRAASDTDKNSRQ